MISSLLFDKSALSLKLKGMKPSKSRDLLVELLNMSNEQLIQAMVNGWFADNYGTSFKGKKLPKKLMPKIIDPNEFFQFTTDCLKKSIGL